MKERSGVTKKDIKSKRSCEGAFGTSRRSSKRYADYTQEDGTDLVKLLRKIEAAPNGSPELDSVFASTFASAPPNVTRSIDAVARLIETELPGW